MPARKDTNLMRLPQLRRTPLKLTGRGYVRQLGSLVNGGSVQKFLIFARIGIRMIAPGRSFVSIRSRWTPSCGGVLTCGTARCVAATAGFASLRIPATRAGWISAASSAAASTIAASAPTRGAGSTIERPRADGTRSVSTANEASWDMPLKTLLLTMSTRRHLLLDNRFPNSPPTYPV